MKAYKGVFFDFDGVLCTDYFYTTLEEAYPKVLDYINEVIFRGEEKFSERWMRGEFNYHDINRLISDTTGISFAELPNYFIESVKVMKINLQILNFAKRLRKEDTPIALVTNNMDVFNEVTIPHNKLDAIFSIIINSSNYGALKHEENGLLYDEACKKLGMSSPEGILLIDDSKRAGSVFESKGGTFYQYRGYQEFSNWLKNNFSII